jgi:hypothetical protein
MKVFAIGYAAEPKFRTGRKEIASYAGMPRRYQWKRDTKRRVKSKIVALHEEAKRGYFITLTQPISIESNKPIALFIDNLKKQGYVKKFVWVRERQQRGANHYHVYFTSDKFLFNGDQYNRKNLAQIFQSAWNSAMCLCGGSASPNSVRFFERPVVYGSCGQIANYLTKYMTKGGDEPEKIRLHASSQGIIYCVSVGIAYDHYLGQPTIYKETEHAHTFYYQLREGWWRNCVELSHYLNNIIINHE